MALSTYLTWGGSQNYSSGPDSGFPVEVTPPFIFWTPGVSLPAQGLNYVIGTLARTDTLLGSISLNAWGPIQTTSTMTAAVSSALDVMAWDDANRFWVASAHTSGAYTISLDDGDNWIDIGTLPSGNAVAIGPMPDGSGVSLPFGGTVHIQFATYQGVVTDTGTNLGITACSGGVAFSHPASGAVVGVLDDSTNTNAHAYSTVDGTTIVDLTSSLPTLSWSTATALSNVNYWTSAAGPANDQLVAFGALVPSTDHSSLLHVTWNGSAFTFANISASNANLVHILSHTAITGVAYNAVLGLWGLMTWDGTNSQLWTSPDLTTWAGQASPVDKAGGLAAVGPYWVTTIKYIIGGVASWRAFASLDGNAFFGVNDPFPGGVFLATPKMAQGRGNVASWSVNGSHISRRQG